MSCGGKHDQVRQAMGGGTPGDLATVSSSPGEKKRCPDCGQYVGGTGHICPLGTEFAQRLGLNPAEVARVWNEAVGISTAISVADKVNQYYKLAAYAGPDVVPGKMPSDSARYAAIWNKLVAPKLYAERVDQTKAAMVGMACGDALAARTEFTSYDQVLVQYGPKGIQELPAAPYYTDDTQMALATAYALHDVGETVDNEAIQTEIARRYIEWARSPENNRAPGMTCMRSIGNLERGEHWSKSGDQWSKGCGTAMRTPPIGLYYRDDPKKLYRVAYDSSKMTHANPTGIAGGVGVAYATKLAADGVDPQEWPDKVREFCAGISSEFDRAMDTLKEVAQQHPDQAMPRLGTGWVAEEAAALAMYCVMQHPDNYVEAVRLAANTRGSADTDSIAAIAGALAGARLGMNAIPRDWATRIEKAEHLQGTAAAALKASLISDAIPDPENGTQKCSACGKFMTRVGDSYVCYYCKNKPQAREKKESAKKSPKPKKPQRTPPPSKRADQPFLFGDSDDDDRLGEDEHGMPFGDDFDDDDDLFLSERSGRGRKTMRYDNSLWGQTVSSVKPLGWGGYTRNFVSDDLAVGRAPTIADIKQLQAKGITAILNVQEPEEAAVSPEIENNFAWRQIPTRDSYYGGIPTTDWLEQCVNQVVEWQRQGHKVYVHCREGKGRSPLVCMGALVKSGKMRLTRAIAQVATEHPNADPNVHQIEVLSRYVQGIVPPNVVRSPGWATGTNSSHRQGGAYDAKR